jgi:hypothetical protein
MINEATILGVTFGSSGQWRWHQRGRDVAQTPVSACQGPVHGRGDKGGIMTDLGLDEAINRGE